MGSERSDGAGEGSSAQVAGPERREPPVSTVGAGTPTVDADDGALDPTPTRSAKYQAIALAIAVGTPASVVAEEFDYTIPGMYALLKRPGMQARIQGVQEELMTRAVAGTSKILLRLDRLVDLELQIADPQPREDGTYAIDPTGKFSRESRHYLMDKVLATRTSVDAKPTDMDPDVRATLVESRELLRKLNDMAALRTRDIQRSPHVHDGAAAVPRALEAGVGEQ